ncbi:galactokinase family protein [Terrimonas pollutisoli]|uniref:galactokinase family protein n=1 Tax=Terrimonas pollutisoli TaxID=3034147 RepID=UPI0023ED788B|nr:galactokinase family protein [Terrimonas sp. H1YJ31]
MNTIDQIQKQFAKIFGNGPASLIVRSPGRVNIIGEHTDYNEGFVLPAAIDKAAYIAISLRDDNEIHLCAFDLNETFSINIDELKPIGDVSWPNYILGSTAQFIKEGVPLKGFNALLTSDVPIGAGLSSSAAVECATVFALDELFQTDFDRISMVKALTPDAFADAVVQERAWEFAGEYTRWFDLVRLEKVEAANANKHADDLKPVGSITKANYWLPIPYADALLNPNLK